MKKYNIEICGCGRIHAIPENVVKETVLSGEGNNKDIALVCGGCGKVKIIGADYVPNCYKDDEEPQYIYDCYSYDVNFDNFTPLTTDLTKADLFKKETELFYDKGYEVPMMTGEYANGYFTYGGGFEDMTYPDFYVLDRVHITIPEVRKWLEEYRKNRKTVNMERFLEETPDDVLESISCYYFEQFDWKGTPFEKNQTA